MRLNILTIALDAMQTLPAIFVELNRLDIDWRWVVVEGASMPVGCTSWIAQQKPRLSRDGTHEFLKSLSLHPRITHIYQTSWEGKVQQLNAGLQRFDTPGVLLEVDADECWTAFQMKKLVELFELNDHLDRVMMRCRYFVGPATVTDGEGYGNNRGEWLRGFRWDRSKVFARHEPPLLTGCNGYCMPPEESVKFLGELDHYSWPTSKVVSEKGALYKYPNAVGGWERLQSAEPGLLKPYLPWVSETSKFRRLF